MLLALVLALAAQTSPAPSPAVPSPVAQGTERPAPVATPAVAPAPDARTPPSGLDPWLVGGLQLAGGSAAACVGCGLAVGASYALDLIPVFGGLLGNIVAPALAGALIGGSETAIGDVFGRQRAGMFLPIVASALSLAVGFVSTVEVSAVVARSAPTGESGVDGLAAMAAVGAATVAVAVALPAVAYAATAVDKAPGDTGQGLPGFFAPAHPKPPARIVVGMAY